MTKTVRDKKVRAFGGVDCPPNKRESKIYNTNLMEVGFVATSD